VYHQFQLQLGVGVKNELETDIVPRVGEEQGAELAGTGKSGGQTLTPERAPLNTHVIEEVDGDTGQRKSIKGTEEPSHAPAELKGKSACAKVINKNVHQCWHPPLPEIRVERAEDGATATPSLHEISQTGGSADMPLHQGARTR
jgi:hypothetical protein